MLLASPFPALTAGIFSYKLSLIAAMPKADLTDFAILLHQLAAVLGFQDVQFATAANSSQWSDQSEGNFNIL